MSNWVKTFTEETNIDVEPFSKDIKAYTQPFNGYYVIAERPNGGKKINYPLRLEEDLNIALNKCQGSKNAVINALIRYALQDIKEKNISVYL